MGGENGKLLDAARKYNLRPSITCTWKLTCMSHPYHGSGSEARAAKAIRKGGEANHRHPQTIYMPSGFEYSSQFLGGLRRRGRQSAATLCVKTRHLVACKCISSCSQNTRMYDVVFNERLELTFGAPATSSIVCRVRRCGEIAASAQGGSGHQIRGPSVCLCPS